jgi:hypothetical protein
MYYESLAIQKDAVTAIEEAEMTAKGERSSHQAASLTRAEKEVTTPNAISFLKAKL